MSFRWVVSSLCFDGDSRVIFSEHKLAPAPRRVCVRALEDGLDRRVIQLPRQDIDLFQSFEAVSVAVDMRVRQPCVELAGVLNVEVLAFDPQRLAGHDLMKLRNGPE